MKRNRNEDANDSMFNLYVLLNQTSDVLFKVRKKELERNGMSPWHTSVLFTLSIIGNKATPAKISRVTLRESQTVSEILITMEKQGLVKRVQDLEKKNLVRIVMTEKGRKIYELSTNRESLHNIISDLSEKQQQQLWSYLLILRNKALEELRMKYNASFPPMISKPAHKRIKQPLAKIK